MSNNSNAMSDAKIKFYFLYFVVVSIATFSMHVIKERFEIGWVVFGMAYVVEMLIILIILLFVWKYYLYPSAMNEE